MKKTAVSLHFCEQYDCPASYGMGTCIEHPKYPLVAIGPRFHPGKGWYDDGGTPIKSRSVSARTPEQLIQLMETEVGHE